MLCSPVLQCNQAYDKPPQRRSCPIHCHIQYPTHHGTWLQLDQNWVTFLPLNELELVEDLWIQENINEVIILAMRYYKNIIKYFCTNKLYKCFLHKYWCRLLPWSQRHWPTLSLTLPKRRASCETARSSVASAISLIRPRQYNYRLQEFVQGHWLAGCQSDFRLVSIIVTLLGEGGRHE